MKLKSKIYIYIVPWPGLASAFLCFALLALSHSKSNLWPLLELVKYDGKETKTKEKLGIFNSMAMQMLLKCSMCNFYGRLDG